MTDERSDGLIKGGCFCGATRFQARLTGDVAVCHCEHCRRATGAPMWSCAEVWRDGFEWTAGSPTPYRHRSDWPTAITRTFCPTCGTTLTYERDESDRLDVSQAAFDDPEVVAPAYHAYASRMLGWVRLDDGLPRHARLPERGDDTTPTD